MEMSSARNLRRVAAWAVAPVTVFVVLLVTLGQVNGSDDPPASVPAPVVDINGIGIATQGGDITGQVQSLTRALESDPRNAEIYGLLGDALYQQFRETGDPSLIERAQSAFDSATELDPENVTATIGQGTLALSRHDFEAGLGYGSRALELAPALVRPYNLIADAQIELGRYGAAAKTLDRFISLKPSLPSYARVSYFRELNGDIDGAVQAMRLAASAAAVGEPLAYVQTLLGNLEFNRGRLEDAELLYRQAVDQVTGGYVPALAGLARIDAARGSFGSAIRRHREVVERLPLPEYAIALAETELAAGRDAAAERDLALVEIEGRLLREAGVNVDVELALFEANHGTPNEAVALGAEVWRQAPSVRSADAYSWALHSAGRVDAALAMSREAMRLGSRDPSFLYHAAQIALAAGDDERARRLLSLLVRQSPRFNPLYGPLAERALADLG